MVLGLALIDQNKPSQRYEDIDPFDTLSFNLAKFALNNGMKQQYVGAAISNYLELTAHDNDRYSAASSRSTRRVSQLEKIAQLLLPKGRTEEALTYLALRQSEFAQGFDRGNDWVGSWALESIQGMSDRKAAYKRIGRAHV